MSRQRTLIAASLACAVLSATAVQGQSASPVVASIDVFEASIEELQRALQSGAVTSRQLVDLYLARIEAYDQHGPALNAIAAINPDVRQAAAALDAERASRGPRGPLHGIPVLVKDNYETIEMPTTAGSLALAGFNPGRDAVMVQKLKAAGAIILGKTNLHEFAAGVVTVGSGFGQTRNPYNPGRNPGGSSGGTGAAVAASFAAGGLGTDTCGSIRIPSAHNNLVGMRGTQGLSSRTGIVPLSLTQDIGGPLARSITDLAILLDATVDVPSAYRAALDGVALRGARVGVVRSLFGAAPEDREVTAVVQKQIDALKAAGAEPIDVAIPGLDDLLRDSSMINADFKLDLAEYLASAPGAPVTSLAEILDRGLIHASLEAGMRQRDTVTARDSEESRRARIKRTAIRQAVEAVLDEHRLIALVYPTVRRKATRIGDAQQGSNCQLSAHSGLPALSVPAGFTDDAVPVGMDLLGRASSEAQLLALGYSVEQTTMLRQSPFSTPALVNGHAPAPRQTTLRFDVPAAPKAPALLATLNLVYDETTSQMRYALAGDRNGTDRIASIWIHAGTVEKPGAARQRVFVAGQPAAGSLALAAADRASLAKDTLVARLFVRDRPEPVTVAIGRLSAVKTAATH